MKSLTAARRKGRPLRAFTGGRRLPATFLRLTPAQIFAQFGSQALTAAVRFLVFAGLLIFHRAGIIGLLPGVANCRHRLAPPGAVWQFPPRFTPPHLAAMRTLAAVAQW
ncbi:MAG TPA: hypothetical protein VK877_07230 [Pseudolabrys sp.]|nr:hypothetical protein [Pseudolabrys sp.]